MASNSPEPGTIIYIKYIKYELHIKYRTYLFKVFMASAVQNMAFATHTLKPSVIIQEHRLCKLIGNVS